MDQRVHPTALAARAKTISMRMGVSFAEQRIGRPIGFFNDRHVSRAVARPTPASKRARLSPAQFSNAR